jgi:hypothetical protein
MVSSCLTAPNLNKEEQYNQTAISHQGRRIGEVARSNGRQFRPAVSPQPVKRINFRSLEPMQSLKIKPQRKPGKPRETAKERDNQKETKNPRSSIERIARWFKTKKCADWES